MPSIRYLNEQNEWVDLGVNSFKGRTGDVMPQTGDYTAAQVGAVPADRKINNKQLDSDITLNASDVGARPNTWTPNASEVGAVALNGGEAMTGNLTIDKTTPIIWLKNSNNAGSLIEHYSYQTRIHNYPETDTTNTYRALIINGSGGSYANPEDMLLLTNRDNGSDTTYRVYHTGNKPTPSAIGAATTTRYIQTILSTDSSWVADDAYFYQDITVNGILETDFPIIGVNTGSNNANNVKFQKWFSKVFRITTSENNIRVWATAKPSSNIPIQI